MAEALHRPRDHSAGTPRKHAYHHDADVTGSNECRNTLGMSQHMLNSPERLRPSISNSAPIVPDFQSSSPMIVVFLPRVLDDRIETQYAAPASKLGNRNS